MAKSVTFSSENQIVIIPRLDKSCFISNLQKIEKRNRRLRYIERYMKKCDLLFTYEYLDLSNSKIKHIRNEYIQFIVDDIGLLNNPHQYITIVS